MADFLLLADGTSRLFLGDGASYLLLGSTVAVAPETDPTPYQRTYPLEVAGTYRLDNARSYQGT